MKTFAFRTIKVIATAAFIAAFIGVFFVHEDLLTEAVWALGCIAVMAVSSKALESINAFGEEEV